MTRTLAAVLLVAATAAVLPSRADDVDRLRAEGFRAAYDLDTDLALARFNQVLAARPDDLVAHRGIATVAWLGITFGSGIVTAEEFLGASSPSRLDLPPPPSRLAALFTTHAARALALADAAVRARPRDPEAHYQLGAAVGLLASYTATVDGRIFSAFRSAQRAYDAHEQVLALDARRKDAGLIVGTYRYLVSTLPAPGRWLAYVAGFGGGRQRGLQMIEAAAAYPGDAQIESLFALVLLYNREARYADALRVLEDLRRRYPRNRLLWLEGAATALRAGRLPDADALLGQGMSRLAADVRPRAFGELALWHQTAGALRLAQRDLAGAERSYRLALEGEARLWVRARAHLGLGKLADLSGDRARAAREYEIAIGLGKTSRDPATAGEARRLLRRPFR